MTEQLALYRKHRPTAFADVRNQEHIVSVLEGAIKKKTIPHAILFSGPRGTGKTTLARIFAKEIGVADVDLYEIDAASNRGIDDVRALKEAVHTLPYESPYKVYIIDEVHMLTKEAFNALLKTLEEPPEYVVFILATTEEEKLLDTILSRCQVFRMRAPSREALAQFVMDASKKEKFKLGKEAANLIAVAADGSFRDALGITQKVIMASGDAAGDADEVATIIGAPRTQTLSLFVKALHERNISDVLSSLQSASDDHVDAKLFMRLALERVRAVMIVRNVPDKKEVVFAPFAEEEQKELSQLLEAPTSALNSHTLLQLLAAAQQLGKTSVPFLPLEAAVMDICQKEA